MKRCQILRSLFLGIASLSAQAGEPFNSCPSKAFLVQDTTARLYGVNLVSGNAPELTSDMGTNSKVNGFGFSVHDRYLYGWGYEAGSLVRIGVDYQVEPLSLINNPGGNYYVGDVSVQENAYYFYKKGASSGLYRVPLDETSSEYLEVSKITDGSALNLTIFDFAFHPDTHLAYSVDKNGDLHRIDVNSGTSISLGNVGQSGTFGAVYFDVEGTFYISRNKDGHIFRINVANSNPTAELFALGPNSGNNDGARCATAPLIDEDDTAIDFGDAPTSYGLTLADNGARHEFDATGLYLGSIVNGESTPKAVDDSDDGVQFITGLEVGLDTLMLVTSSSVGYLNAWFDWNQNGEFDNSEQAVISKSLVAGENHILLEVPNNALVGSTWMRFRVTENPTVTANGGVSNGEVEDYQQNITDPGMSTTYYPGASSWVSLAYEDLWPETGDYDFNDVVLNYRTTVNKVGSNVIRYVIEGELNAVGAGYHNGFAVRFKNLPSGYVNTSLIRHEIGGVIQSGIALESGRSEAILIVIPDTKTVYSSACTYFRTNGCESDPKISFKITLPLSTFIDSSIAPLGLLDPFIFAVNGFAHGDYVNINNARSWEVHLKNKEPTEAFDLNLLTLEDDASNVESGFYYQTENGLPWAMEVGVNWSHPKENVDLIIAYPLFNSFARSSGVDNSLWFNSPDSSKVINN
ncbi:LruC domain-containing protein [Pseudoalteromonas denitrificans]|uniref:LruC domain-containing protein n=1 Tax=Pseudoalteromonas denitrificans DSM 6059 TaxID=1123010 RepID=A0A1I1EQ43_9GAMM|nr:LruC domain-containing protein [Pseudoalteromonas denitrificans]SFB88806.1 LruC domain-containing protein [Pseudoalteromonas denitrificans DSM 6059]